MAPALALTLVAISLLAMIFGIVYLGNKEKMAMIERGMDPRSYKAQPAPYRYLKWGLLMMGAGTGLFLANILTRTILTGDEDENVAIYFGLISICGGLGLFISYLIEKKEVLDKE
ncbi:DUF6249 domain-containing protein [Mucilaginibacter defluvii]|uniref:DUF6249 domain-containing protein n=1 Tax=Mucilaginibacter defluvii TaxID=1196019 RepID=A0ABP9G034_9SPHI